MARYILKRKTYAVTPGQEIVAVGDVTTSAPSLNTPQGAYQVGKNVGLQEGQKNMATEVANAKKSVGITQGARNTWNKMGTLGKATTVAAGVTAAGLIGKSLLSNNSNKD